MSRVRKGPKPKLMIMLLVLGFFLIFIGEYYFSSGRLADGMSRSEFPTLIGVLIFVIDAVLFVIWRVRRDRPHALEDSFRRDDSDV